MSSDRPADDGVGHCFHVNRRLFDCRSLRVLALCVFDLILGTDELEDTHDIRVGVD